MPITTHRLVVPSLIAVTIALGACITPSFAKSQKRHFTVLAVEPKGGTTLDKEPFPGSPLPAGGYVLTKPDNTGRWEGSAYVWAPSQIVVHQGDEVTLEFVGINGAAHPTTIEVFGQTFTIERGKAHRVTFVADKVGAFGIVCATHLPSMRGELVVLPRP